jgi:hypothetical protein
MIRKHVVVDGSNIATEARSSPSLRQLDEAVRAFLTEHPTEHVTVVVDATFGHRIDESERADYEAAVNAGEIITAPAGTIGRGDAFVLQVADKAGASILSNDSFQEFHGQYPWLFDEGRLVGGKPVPPVGWVFLLRSPVRGAISRRAMNKAKDSGTRTRTTKKSTKKVKKVAARAPSRAKKKAAKATKKVKASAKRTTRETTEAPASRRSRTAAAPPADEGASRDGAARPGARPQRVDERSSERRKPGEPLNEPLAFIEFVGAHPIGSVVEGTVDQFSSHGAYVSASGARCYVPLKLMGDPPPRSAKDVLRLGATRQFLVHAFDVPRRGVDLALVEEPTESPGIPGVSGAGAEPVKQEGATRKTSRSTRARRARSTQPRRDRESTLQREVVTAEEERTKTHTKASGLATTTRADQSAEEAPVTPAKRASAKRAGRKSAAKRGSKKATAKRRSTKKAAKKRTAKRTTKRSTAKRGAKKAAKKRPAKKRSTKKAAKRRSTKKAAKKRPAKKRAAKKRSTKKAAKKRPAKRRSTKKAAKRRSTRRR